MLQRPDLTPSGCLMQYIYTWIYRNLLLWLFESFRDILKTRSWGLPRPRLPSTPHRLGRQRHLKHPETYPQIIEDPETWRHACRLHSLDRSTPADRVTRKSIHEARAHIYASPWIRQTVHPGWLWRLLGPARGVKMWRRAYPLCGIAIHLHIPDLDTLSISTISGWYVTDCIQVVSNILDGLQRGEPP